MSYSSNDKPGCLSGLGKFALLSWAFDWLQNRFGFGRRGSLISCGCGILLVLAFLAIACSIITSTDWTSLF